MVRKNPATAKKIVWSVYLLVDPISKQTRYVGMTSAKLSVRVSGHVSQARSGAPDKKSEWVRRLVSRRTRPICVLVAEFDLREDAARMERSEIARLRTEGASIFNTSIGCEGRSASADTMTTAVLLRVNKTERAALESAAAAAGEPLSTWIREQALRAAG